MPRPVPTRVLVLGGGFGGVTVARELERLLGDDAPVEVTLVNRDNFFLFTPMLHEVAASDLDLAHIVSPLRKLLRRTGLFTGQVERIDLDRRRVVVSHGGDHEHELPYDHLVIALGNITNFYGIAGLRERALTMKSLGDAIHLRNRTLAHLEQADFECAAEVRRPLLTFVVAGGGFAGVETLAALNDFAREALPFYRNLEPADVRMVLVHAGPHLLPELGPELGGYARRKLEERGVEVALDTRVAGYDGETVELSDGRRFPARTLVWTAGTSPNSLLRALPCATRHGRIAVDHYLEVEGRPDVWALGDCAYVPDALTGGAHPPTAQHAIREGATVAHNIAARIRGGERRAFAFSTIGQLAAIGRRAGVARVLGLRFSGFVAWWLWRTIYLAKLPRLEKKVRVALDWTLDLLFSKDLVQFQTVLAPSISRAEGEEAQASAALPGASAPSLPAPPARSAARAAN